jgi:hypothetical protein
MVRHSSCHCLFVSGIDIGLIICLISNLAMEIRKNKSTFRGGRRMAHSIPSIKRERHSQGKNNKTQEEAMTLNHRLIRK